MLLQNTAIYLAARVVPSVLGVLGIAIYTRLLDPEGYGLFVLIFSGASLTQVWLFEWLRLATLRYLARYQTRRAAFSSSLALAFLTMTLLLALLAGAASLLGLAPGSQLLVGAVLALAIGLFGLVGAITWADLAPLRFTWMTLLQAVLMFAIAVPALLLGGGPLALVGALTFAFLAAVLPTLAPEFVRLRLTASRGPIIRRCWRYGFPVSLASSFGLVVMSSDRFMIAWLIDTGAAGTFAAGYWISAHPISAVLVVVSQAAVPLAVTAFERGGTAAARAQLTNNLTLLLGIGLPAAVGVALVREELAAVLLGAEFRAATIPLIPWISLAALLQAVIAYHFYVPFQLAQKTLPLVIIGLAAAVLNVGLNLWWIQAFGLLGAALASVAAYVFALIVTEIWVHRIITPPPLSPDLLKIGLATAVMALVVWRLPDTGLIFAPPLLLAVRIFVGGAVYGGALYVLDVGGVRGILKTRLATLATAGRHGHPPVRAEEP